MRTSVKTRSVGVRQLRHVEAAELNTRLEPSRDTAILYTHVLCPYAQRAWLVLLEKASKPCQACLTSFVILIKN